MFDIQTFKNNSSSDAMVHEMRFDNAGLDNTKLIKKPNTFYLGLCGSPRLTYFFSNNDTELSNILAYINSDKNIIFSVHEITNNYITIIPNFDYFSENVWLDYMDDGWVNSILPYTLATIGDTPTIVCRFSVSEPTEKTYSLKYCKLNNSSIDYTSDKIKSLFVMGVDAILSVDGEDDRFLLEAKGEYSISANTFTISSPGQSYIIILEETA